MAVIHLKQDMHYLQSTIKQFKYYKLLGDKTMAQLSDDQLFWKYNDESNSIAMIVKHIVGNMLSRWTDFRTADGEKEWRNRESEFANDIKDRKSLEAYWNKGFNRLLDALHSITDSELEEIIYIRNQGHTILEAINRQLAHYPYHVGQIVFIGKMLIGEEWISLSIPKGESTLFNENKFSNKKERGHYTDEFLKKD